MGVYCNNRDYDYRARDRTERVNTLGDCAARSNIVGDTIIVRNINSFNYEIVIIANRVYNVVVIAAVGQRLRRAAVCTICTVLAAIAGGWAGLGGLFSMKSGHGLIGYHMGSYWLPFPAHDVLQVGHVPVACAGGWTRLLH